jgi:hypothetical protein
MDGTTTSELDINLENENAAQSLSGAELPSSWPQILTLEQEQDRYQELYDQGDNTNEPPINPHVERLSYELQNGSKRLRFFATYHQRDISGPDDPNRVQYDVIENKFNESPPQLVLYEGIVDDANYPLTREKAISLGEPAFMVYLVQQHNANLKEDAEPIAIESGDVEVNTQSDNQIRDEFIVSNTAEKFKKYDKIDIAFGSGHAIRQRVAWEQYFK